MYILYASWQYETHKSFPRVIQSNPALINHFNLGSHYIEEVQLIFHLLQFLINHSNDISLFLTSYLKLLFSKSYLLVILPLGWFQIHVLNLKSYLFGLWLIIYFLEAYTHINYKHIYTVYGSLISLSIYNGFMSDK